MRLIVGITLAGPPCVRRCWPQSNSLGWPQQRMPNLKKILLCGGSCWIMKNCKPCKKRLPAEEGPYRRSRDFKSSSKAAQLAPKNKLQYVTIWYNMVQSTIHVWFLWSCKRLKKVDNVTKGKGMSRSSNSILVNCIEIIGRKQDTWLAPGSKPSTPIAILALVVKREPNSCSERRCQNVPNQAIWCISVGPSLALPLLSERVLWSLCKT